MKKFFLITMASLISVCAMAIGGGDGSTKADAKEFDWDKGVTHPGGTLWYRVDLKPLYEEENPSLTLYLTNPSNVVGSSVNVSMKATVAGQEESKDYTIAARQYKTYTANAKALITLKQTEIYLTLKSDGEIKLSAKVFEAADLDETCKDARTLKWGETAVQNPMYSAWWKVNLKPVKDAPNLDAKITITNTGSKTVNLKMGQSLDCPSSGMTKREYTLAPSESIEKKVPRDMITSVQPDELYFGVENVESQVSILVETVAQPPIPVIDDTENFVDLHVTDTIKPLKPKTYYRIKVADMDSILKYEPEFTYRNESDANAKVTVKMAFKVPAYSTSDAEYDLAPGEEEIVVYKKNMLEGLGDDVEYIYLLTEVQGEVNFYGRFKHVREGKACKTNIDFNWETGHTQEARTTQWYAIRVADARDRLKDIMVYILNQGTGSANMKASMAFSCPYIDLTETSRTIGKNDTVSRRLGFSSYAMMSDTIWIGLETNQDIKFWADTVDAEKKAVVDSACMDAKDFDWEKGDTISANTPTWFRIDMTQVREKAAKFPTVFVQNMSSTEAAKITAEMSLECPDSIANQSETLTIKANDSYSRKMARNMFENIVQDEIYLRVVSTQKISLQIRLNEEAEGTSCNSAIPFNDISGNSQAANSNLWYVVDLRKAMKDSLDLNLMIENKDAKVCEGVGQLTFGCPDEDAPSVQSFTLASKQKKTLFRTHSAFQLLPKGDSVVYINLQGNTAMHISMEYVTPASFDKITGPDTNLDTLLFNAKNAITQNAARQWYLIPKEEVKHMRDTIKVVPLTPNIQIENSDDSNDYDVTIEAAFAFPIVEKMISQKVTVPGGQSLVQALDYKLFKQAITNFDSVLVRIEIPAAAAGKLRIKSSLDKAFNGNTRETASPIVIGEEYVQDGNTTMWYKLKTADWKKDKSLINKRINVRTSNKGNAATTIKVAVYEGLQAKVDMFEQFALENYRERTIKKGEDRNRDFPAQNILMVGDVELYIQVTTTEKITFRTKIDGEYAKIADKDIDTTQFEAQLLAPNADYLVPGDNKYHWYQICIPYIRDNHKYSHESSLTYELNDQATIEVLNTFMDTMRYNFPSRKRTVNKAKKHYVDTTLLSDLLSKGLARFTDQKFDITTFDENFVDSMLHRYVTSDSITMYIRYKTDADMTVRLNMPQVKGLDCKTSVKFDWEHGFINPTEQTNYIHVQLDSTRVPKGKDLKLHMDRWADVLTNVKADFFAEDCQGDPLGSLNKTIDRDTFRILKREFLQNIGWSGLMIQYYSDTTTHLWAELIESVIPDTIKDTIPMFVCKKDSIYFPDTAYCFYQDSSVIVLKDSVNKSEGKYYKWQILYNVKLLQRPDFAKLHLQIDELENEPDIKSGAAIDVTATTTEIDSILNVNHKDSIQKVDTIIWEYFYIGDDNFKPFPMPKPVLTETAIALRYYVVTECVRDTIWSNPYIHVPRHTDTITTCGPYTWPTTGETYKKIGITTDSLRIVRWTSPNVEPKINLDSVRALILTITPDILPTAIVDTCAKEYKWSFNDSTYTATTSWTVYVDTILDTVSGCYQIDTLKLRFTPEPLPTVTVDTCSATFTWDFNNLPYTPTATWTEYTDTVPDAGGSCYQACTLKLRFTPDTLKPEVIDTCQAYTWFNGNTYTKNAKDTVMDTIAGCCTVRILDLTITPIVVKETVPFVCNDYHWSINDSTYDSKTTDTVVVSHTGECDTTYILEIDSVGHPTYKTLRLVSKYGNRLLLIDRKQINDSTEMYLDLEKDQDKVVWYVEDPAGDKPVGKPGYYLTNPNGSQNGLYIQPGKTYYAKIELPEAGACGYKAETEHYTIPKASSAPALAPSLVRPGEDIQVLNLNPEETTTIRVYTSEGLIQGTYTAHGEETFAIKAAKEHGFYLVELRSESDQSTLRYIVK